MESASGKSGAKRKPTKSAKSTSVQVKVKTAKKAVVSGGAKKQASLTIKNKTGPKERIESKMSKVEALHNSRKQTAPLVAISAPVKKLMLPSPFRFPLDTDRVASQTARYAGLTLVTLGASLALFYVQFIELPVSAISQLGAACSATDLLCLMREQNSTEIQTATYPINENGKVTEPTPVNSTNEGIISATSGQTRYGTTAQVNEMPAVFTVGSPEPLHGIVPISITVADAQAVNVSAFYDEWDRTISLGSAHMQNGAWVYQWDTSKFQNGRYKLKALIKNTTGTYEQVSERYVVVKNQEPIPEEASIPSTVSPGPLSATLNSDGTEVTLTQTFPEVKSSDVIKVYLVKSDGAKLFVDDDYLFTQAYQKTNVTWKQTFNVHNFPGGSYTLRAERWRGGTHFDSSEAELSLTGVSTHNLPDAPLTNTTNATLSVRNASNASGFTDVTIESTDATFIEIYAVNTASISNIFLGLARKTSAGLWVFNWDTRQIPNSRYNIFARIGSSRGTYESNKIVVSVFNERTSAPTATQVEELSVRTEQYEELLPDNVVVRNNFWNLTTATTTDPKLDEFIEENKSRIQDEFQKLAAALRSANESSITSANTRLLGLENEFRDFVDGEDNFDDLVTAYQQYVDGARDRIGDDVKKIEQIIAERTNDGLFSDTDWDGVTDFDELYIYNTDPFLADTSGNGIPDGVAILNGLDPLSTSIDASIVFESPQDVGIVRDDLLTVESIISVKPDEDPEITTLATAVIAGKALPNSFVTIFIFSTPIIVTVKTESDGSWQYRFEKELENGEHSVYVALTDNSGRIIARSSPLRFIKEAEAYTTIDEALASYGSADPVENDYSFFSSSVLYLVMSFAVVTIGLVLLLLGMYIDRRRRDDIDSSSQLLTASV